MSDALILLVDNGSKRPSATLSLRTLAARLGDANGQMVHPVSLQHADRIPAELLGGRSVDVFGEFMRAQLSRGQRRFIVVPLFFGPSRAISSFIPQQLEALRAEYGDFDLDIADVLVPLPGGEPRIAAIVAEQVTQCRFVGGGAPSHVVLVDHGSPIAAVTAVRSAVARDLAHRLPDTVHLSEAVMERRPGPEYDFNGPLLEQELDRIGAAQPDARVAVGMLFLQPGRHAGEGGDIAEICAAAMARQPGLQVVVSPLVGEHPGLIEVLRDRLAAAG